MSSSLKFKKVYIDTKFMTPDSSSSSDFSIELPETMHFDNNSSVFYIDDVCIPPSWYSIEKDFNDKLYLYIGTVSTPMNSAILTLSPGNYTGTSLASEIEQQAKDSSDLPFDVFKCQYNSKTNLLSFNMNPATSGGTIAPTVGFSILTPADLKTSFNGRFTKAYNINNPCDCNEVIGNVIGVNTMYTQYNKMEKGQVNLQPIRNIYMHSSALGNLSNIGPDGSQTVIKKIPVTADYNNYIYDQTVLYNDYNSCSGQTLKKLDFQFKTARGEIIPFNGLNVSFSIVFSRAQPDA